MKRPFAAHSFSDGRKTGGSERASGNASLAETLGHRWTGEKREELSFVSRNTSLVWKQ